MLLAGRSQAGRRLRDRGLRKCRSARRRRLLRCQQGLHRQVRRAGLLRDTIGERSMPAARRHADAARLLTWLDRSKLLHQRLQMGRKRLLLGEPGDVDRHVLPGRTIAVRHQKRSMPAEPRHRHPAVCAGWSRLVDVRRSMLRERAIPTASGICCAPSQVTSVGQCCPAGQVPDPKNRRTCVTMQTCSPRETLVNGACCNQAKVYSDINGNKQCCPQDVNQANGTCEAPGMPILPPGISVPPTCFDGYTKMRDGTCCANNLVTPNGRCAVPGEVPRLVPPPANVRPGPPSQLRPVPPAIRAVPQNVKPGPKPRARPPAARPRPAPRCVVVQGRRVCR